MPLLQRKYQPYFPDPDSPNRIDCEGAYCHPLLDGDTVYTQFTQTPCAASEIEDPTFSDQTLGTEVLDNGTFTGGATEWETGVVPTPLPSNGWSYSANAIHHAAGTLEAVYQTALATPLVVGFYQIEIDITRVSGSVYVKLGDPGTLSRTDSFDSTGVHTQVVYFSDILDQLVSICPDDTDDFDGSINSISVKPVTYGSWNPNGGWLLDGGQACHIEGSTGILEESVADYIEADEYYEIGVTITGYISGEVDVYIANVLAGTISGNGTFYLYATPTLTGVVSFDPSSDFVGCLNFDAVDDSELQPGLYQLKNDHLAYLIDEDEVETAIGQFFTYYERWVTLIFNLNDLEIEYGCYTIKVTDACVVTGENLIINPTFDDSGADWSAAAFSRNYANPAGELQFVLDPIEGADYVVNGDFSGGAASWTLGAGWSISGGGALHTAGSTATLQQAVVVPARQPDPTLNFWFVQFTISGRTAGSVSVTLGDYTRTGFTANDIITNGFLPTVGGAINLIFTPTTDFDGTIDDVSIHYTNTSWGEYVSSLNTVNTNIIAGNYEMTFEITSLSDPLFGVGVRIIGQSGATTYFDTVGTHTVQIPNYVPGSQQVQIIGKFQTGLNYIIPGTINVDNIDLHAVEPFEATYTSECLDYRAEHPNTRMIVAYCDQPSFGFEFANTGFLIQQRVVCRSLNPRYPSQVDIQKSGNGDARVTYAEQEKYWQFVTDYVSETFHDTFSIQQKCDHLLIGTGPDNGKEYIFSPDEYQPEWRTEGDYSLSPVTGSLRIKAQGEVFNRHI